MSCCTTGVFVDDPVESATSALVAANITVESGDELVVAEKQFALQQQQQGAIFGWLH
jgi:hypothetical protein